MMSLPELPADLAPLLIVSLATAACVLLLSFWRRAHARAEDLAARERVLDAELKDVRDALHASEIEVAQLSARGRSTEEARSLLGETFSSLGSEALRNNNAQFLELARESFSSLLADARGEAAVKEQAIDNLLSPVREGLASQAAAIKELESKREAAYASIVEQVKQMATDNQRLGEETSKLVSALRRPEQRGRWGEMQLRNVVELAGMSEHCDFEEQVGVATAEGLQRPDMLVKLPGEGVIVVDSKVALDAYLSALESGADRQGELKRHASQVEAHWRSLASKRYWDQFTRTPKLVVMFMPLESALVAALEVDPECHAKAMASNVLIATPTLLVALLRAVAYGWQQDGIADNAREIARTGKELHARLATFVGHIERVGHGIDKAGESYNRAIGSLERMVLPSARRLIDLQATAEPDITPPRPIDGNCRAVTAKDCPSDGEAPEQLPAEEDEGI